MEHKRERRRKMVKHNKKEIQKGFKWQNTVKILVNIRKEGLKILPWIQQIYANYQNNLQ